ncbi:MAG: stage III sporulation protein AC [Ruminococcus sp.]|nr:stage III sporulation protein AC [Ruminococcus sp.]MCD7727670.1 stage III sporulation protein AC [Ruminococcus sp.]MCD7773861.1 stage III sporulation protein AC [Ruminococcus sp.]
MEVDLIFKIAGVGIIVSILNILLKKAERDEQAMMITIAGLVIVLILVINQVSELFETIKSSFGF